MKHHYVSFWQAVEFLFGIIAVVGVAAVVVIFFFWLACWVAERLFYNGE